MNAPDTPDRVHDPILAFIDTLAITPARSDDMRFVYSSWLKSFEQSDFGRSLPKDAYYALQHRRIERIVQRGRVLVARDAEDGDLIRGWLASDEVNDAYVFHYCFVKHPFRRLGIATLLLDHDLELRGLDLEGAIYTHVRRPAVRTLQELGLTFVPMLACDEFLGFTQE